MLPTLSLPAPAPRPVGKVAGWAFLCIPSFSFPFRITCICSTIGCTCYCFPMCVTRGKESHSYFVVRSRGQTSEIETSAKWGQKEEEEDDDEIMGQFLLTSNFFLSSRSLAETSSSDWASFEI